MGSLIRVFVLALGALVLQGCDRSKEPIPFLGPDGAPIRIELPRAAADALDAPVQVVVLCDPDSTRVEFEQHRWRLPAQPGGLDLQPLVQALGDRRAQAQVTLYAAPSLAYGRVIAVMDALKGAGLQRLALAVPKAEEK